MKSPWFGFYVADYLAKTGHLTQAQHGAYLLLMLHYYATENPIPANAMQVHAICRCTTDAERYAATKVLELFFTREGDIYRHKRIDEELATRSELRTKRQKAASERWNAQAMQVHTQSQSHIGTTQQNKVLIPTREEVKAYCLERVNSVNPDKWFDFYQSKGWKVGNQRMKDWKAAVRTWEGRDAEKPGVSKSQERISRNRAAILEGLGYSPNAGFGGSVPQSGSDASGSPLLVGRVQEREPGDS